MKKYMLLIMLLTVTLIETAAWGAPVKVFVAGVKVAGVTNGDEMQSMLQSALASRIAGGGVATVGAAASADVVISASYLVSGKIFSLDAVATRGGAEITRAFVQGDGQDDLIPAVGRLADKLRGEISATAPPMPVTAAPVVAVPAAAARNSGDADELVKITEKIQSNSGSWRSKPLPTALNLIAAGPVAPDGSRDIFLADNHCLYYYRKGSDLKLVSTREIPVFEKIISLDLLEAGADGYDLYLSVVRDDRADSQLLHVQNGTVTVVTEGLPFLFRTMTTPGDGKKLYAQKTDGKGILTGAVFEAERQDKSILLKKELVLPPKATLYNFSPFTDGSGQPLMALLGSNNQLYVYNREFQELWHSTEQYGGSELFIERIGISSGEDQGKQLIYLNQRIVTAGAATLLVGKNEPRWMFGRKGDYKNGSVYCLVWNGEALEGKWHTRVNDNYLPDFQLDSTRKELLQLELTSQPSIISKGSSTVIIRKVEL